MWIPVRKKLKCISKMLVFLLFVLRMQVHFSVEHQTSWLVSLRVSCMYVRHAGRSTIAPWGQSCFLSCFPPHLRLQTVYGWLLSWAVSAGTWLCRVMSAEPPTAQHLWERKKKAGVEFRRKETPLSPDFMKGTDAEVLEDLDTWETNASHLF